MPGPAAAQICPPLTMLDELLLVRSGARPVCPQTPWGLDLPLDPGDDTVELIDPEGVPLARIDTSQAQDGHIDLTAQPVWLGEVSTRPFEQLYLPPDRVRATAQADGASTVVVDRPLRDGDLDDVAGAPLTLLVLAGPSVEPDARSLSAIRSALAVRATRPRTQVATVPLAPARATTDPGLLAAVLDAYSPTPAARLAAAPDHDADRTGPGLVLFFTGLSGSGKSTLARAVRNAVLEQDGRAVTLLDGDVVRRNLSAGLSFSPQDRETNIRRIGWVAAQIAHHGGLAICSPIAPYERTRQEVRRMVTERGGTLVLVHVATPVEECERRDRKGLYAKARTGEIANFTGVSAPYEPPADADLVLDTTGRSIEEVRDEVLALLGRRRLLTLDADR